MTTQEKLVAVMRNKGRIVVEKTDQFVVTDSKENDNFWFIGNDGTLLYGESLEDSINHNHLVPIFLQEYGYLK